MDPEAASAGGFTGARVVLAGGSGLLGRHLAMALAAAGARVTILSRSPARTAEAGLDVQPWEALPRVLEGAAAVVNLAGESIAGGRWTAARKARLVASRLQSTARIVAALTATADRPPVFLNASAIGYYGHRPEGTCDEASPPGVGFFPELCLAWEAAAAKAGELGVRVATLRTGVVLARDGGALPRMAAPVRWGFGASLGHGRQLMSWIHVDDLTALALAILADPGYRGPVNGTAPEPVSHATFQRTLGDRLRRPILPVPGFLTATAVRLLLGEMAGPLLLEGAAVLPAKALERGFRFRFATVKAALADLLPAAGRPNA